MISEGYEANGVGIPYRETERTLKQGKCPRSAMTERKKEDEKKPARLAPFVEPQLFLAVEEANRRLKEIMKVTDPTTGLYRSIQRITEVSEMMLRRQDQLRKLYEPSESVSILKESGNWSSNSLE